MPKVSVILSTYNRAYILRSAIESVLNQSYGDLELIVVDDGSTDNTEQLVKSMSDARIVYVKHDKNYGLATGRNTGLAKAGGEYIAFQDSDDMWEKEKLSRHVPLLDESSNTVAAVYGMLEKVLKDGSMVIQPAEHIFPMEGNIHEQILRRNFITMQVALVRASVFRAVGLFDPAIYSLEDWDFWIRCTQKFEVRFDPYICVHAVVMGDSLTSNRPLRLDDRARAYEKNRQAFTKYPSIRCEVLTNIAKGYLYAGNARKTRTYITEALMLKKSLRAMIIFCASFFPRSLWRFGAKYVAISLR